MSAAEAEAEAADGAGEPQDPAGPAEAEAPEGAAEGVADAGALEGAPQIDEEGAAPPEALDGTAPPAAQEGGAGEPGELGEAGEASEDAVGGAEGAEELAPGDGDAQDASLNQASASVDPQDGLEAEGGVDSAMLPPGAEDEEGSRRPSRREVGDEEGDEDLDEEQLAELEALEDEEEEEEVEEEPKVDPMIELREKLDELIDLKERAKQRQKELQARVLQRRTQEKAYDAAEKQSEGKVTDHKYENALQNVHKVRLKLRLQQVKAARMSDMLKGQLETKRQKAIECRDSFQEFKRQVAKHAEYARTGRKIPDKIIQEVEEFELDKDAEVEEVRGSNISLKNRLAKLEQLLRKKDELAANLHVIDFEQLKIENQTLNEKIEERNEELHKLRKKTIVTVQIITHMREKVQFVQQEYEVLKRELAQLDQDLAAQRELVAKTKHERDDHRSEYAKLRQQTGITNSENLAKDYEQRAEHIKTLKDDIGALKKRHSQMAQFIKKAEAANTALTM